MTWDHEGSDLFNLGSNVFNDLHHRTGWIITTRSVKMNIKNRHRIDLHDQVNNKVLELYIIHHHGRLILIFNLAHVSCTKTFGLILDTPNEFVSIIILTIYYITAVQIVIWSPCRLDYTSGQGIY